LGSLKTRVSYSIFCLLVIENRSTYVVNMGWERILTLKIFNITQSLEINYDFLLYVVISVSKPMKNHLNITHVPHLCEIAEVNRNTSVYSSLYIQIMNCILQVYIILHSQYLVDFETVLGHLHLSFNNSKFL
jgi:hypothetical protein